MKCPVGVAWVRLRRVRGRSRHKTGKLSLTHGTSKLERDDTLKLGANPLAVVSGF